MDPRTIAWEQIPYALDRGNEAMPTGYREHLVHVALVYCLSRLTQWTKSVLATLCVALLVLIFLSDVSLNASTNVSVGQDQSVKVQPSAQPSGVIIPITP